MNPLGGGIIIVSSMKRSCSVVSYRISSVTGHLMLSQTAVMSKFYA